LGFLFIKANPGLDNLFGKVRYPSLPNDTRLSTQSFFPVPYLSSKLSSAFSAPDDRSRAAPSLISCISCFVPTPFRSLAPIIPPSRGKLQNNEKRTCCCRCVFRFIAFS